MSTTKTVYDRLSDWAYAYKIGQWDGDTTPEEFLAEYKNVEHAEVHDDGTLYIEGPQDGQYLNAEDSAGFVKWLEERKAIEPA